MERETLLVGGNCVQAGGCGRAGEVHRILLSGTKELGDDDSGRMGSDQLLSLVVGGEIPATRPFPNQGREGGNLRP